VLAERARVLRTYGQDAGGTIDVVGASGRLDELQAAFLRVRLRRLDEDNRRRADIVAHYDAAVGRSSPPGVHHVYVVRSSRRDELRAHFADAGIATAVHYPRPLDEHGALADAERIEGLETSRRAAQEVLSLPCHPYLTSEEEALVASALERAAALVDVV
jgi:dTDP-3-amino-3,4,6-trideoxy-alpha-D-glucose transaminase